MAPRISTDGQRHHVFLYGTLKSDQPNGEKICNKQNGEAKLVCKTVTVERWPLVVATQHGIPFLLGRKGVGQLIKGELYEIDDKMLAFLDYFEQHPDVYKRTVIKVKVLDNLQDGKYVIGEEYSCMTYILFQFSDILLDLQTIEEYDDEKMEVKFDRNLATKNLEPTMAELGIVVKK